MTGALTRDLGVRLEGRVRAGGGPVIDVRDPYRGMLAARVTSATAHDIDEVIAAAADVQPRIAGMPVHERASALRRVADELDRRAPELADAISRQTGKVLKDTLREAGRAPWTFRAAATAIETLAVEAPPADAMPGGEGLAVILRREPVGVVGAITPFNAPLNLTAHKVAPALAAGNAIVLKPAPSAPITTYELADIVESCGFPAGAVGIVPGGADTATTVAAHPGIAMVTFTGGVAAGRAIHAAAGMRRCLLELGGNSPNIVHADANLAAAAAMCVDGGYRNAGQSCNSVQRILVHADVAERFVELLAERVSSLIVGDPLDADTDVGPVVSEDSACRVQELVDDARAHGAEVRVGGGHERAVVEPSVLVSGAERTRLDVEEVFAPLCLVSTYDDLDQAIERANATEFGLQSAVFTGSLDVAMRATRLLRAGAVLVNRTSNFRLDHLPYGGLRNSGIGREGPRFAVEEMTEIKLAVLAPATPHPGWGA